MDELLLSVRIVSSVVTLYLFHRQHRRYQRKLQIIARIHGSDLR